MQNGFTAKFSQECKHVFVFAKIKEMYPHIKARNKLASKFIYASYQTHYSLSFTNTNNLLFQSSFLIVGSQAEQTLCVSWRGGAEFKVF